MSDNEHPEPIAPPEPMAQRTPITQIIGRIVLAMLFLVLVIFAAANAQYVSFSWVLGETRATFDETGGHVSGGVRLIGLLIGAAALGMLMGLILAWQSGRSRRRRAGHKG